MGQKTRPREEGGFGAVGAWVGEGMRKPTRFLAEARCVSGGEG